MIAIIPARGGSKGLPGKNIRLLNGKPLISYTIIEALNSEKISRVIVSTDDTQIAEIAIQYGAEVPFLRPDYLSTDTSKAIDNYTYTIERLNDEGVNEAPINNFVVLQPTSPLRTRNDIDKAINLFYEKKADSVISVNKSETPPSWYKKINDEGVLVDYFEGIDNSLNRQEEVETFLPNGAIYILNYSHLNENNSYYSEKTFPYVMEEVNSVDIDTLIDFKLAEILLLERTES